MELHYIVMTIIKILISVPCVLLLTFSHANAAALIGGHMDNNSNLTNKANLTSSYDFQINLSDSNSQEIVSNATVQEVKRVNNINPEPMQAKTSSEEIPDPSPLVLPGYNLPENIFNKGKPFYLEKDPLTGTIDFNSKTPQVQYDDEYDYVEEIDPSSNIYEKANINRKDGPLSGSHKPSDINQLTPNFHDFLNLPVKYNPDKYVYPLISSSYANTKVQGNVNKHQNHKNYVVTTYKPTLSPTYYTTKHYFSQDKVIEFTTRKASTNQIATSTKEADEVYLTTEANLMNSPMNHPSFNEDYYKPTPKQNLDEIYITTENSFTTQSPTVTTKRSMSLFEQLFGSDYEESTTEMSTESQTKPTPPKLFSNLPSTPKPPVNKLEVNNVLTGSNMGRPYEYEDEYAMSDDNVMVESNPPTQEISFESTQKVPTDKTSPQAVTDFEEYEYDYQDKTTKSQPITTTIVPISTTIAPTKSVTEAGVSQNNKITSLPLGENHVTHNNRQPIIVATQNLRESLSHEKVQGAKFPTVVHPQAPSTSNIHILPDQDTVSFVVGNHQNVDGGGYVGSTLKESPYESNPFRPVYGIAAPTEGNVKEAGVSYTIQTTQEMHKPLDVVAYKPQVYKTAYKPQYKQVDGYKEIKFPEVIGSSVTIQPIRNSEASLSIGMPVGVKAKLGQVVDEELDIDQRPKIVFPDDKVTTDTSDLSPPPPPHANLRDQIYGNREQYNPNQLQPAQDPNRAHPVYQNIREQQIANNREVLKLNSKPMFHQLPSDLTPPNEKEASPPQQPQRIDRIRPPWDPRPGHFHLGRPEYARPPRPNAEVYKRIDNLPNILPQFRPNTKHHSPYQHHGPPNHYNQNVHKAYLRQPLLERPSNRPIAFFEKLHPPPPPPKNLQSLRKVLAVQNDLIPKPQMAEDRISQDRNNQNRIRQDLNNQEHGISQDRISQDRNNQERISQDRNNPERISQDLNNQDRISNDRNNQERISQDRNNQDHISQDRNNQDSISQDRISPDSNNQDRFSQDLNNQDRISQDRISQDRFNLDRNNQDRVSQDRFNQDRFSQDRNSQDRISQDRNNQDRNNQDRNNQDRNNQDRISLDRNNQDRNNLDRNNQDRNNLDRNNQDRNNQERINLERIYEERINQERNTQERLKQERLNQDRLNQDRINLERINQDRMSPEGIKKQQDNFGFLQLQAGPPKVVIANRRNGNDDDLEVETLQMIQAKLERKESKKDMGKASFKTSLNGKDSIEKPLYVVYPVNSPPIKLDVIEENKKEAVVVGTRAELPLPPSKINQEYEFDYQPPKHVQEYGFENVATAQKPSDYQNKLNQEFNFEQKNRHDSPILRPHPRPSNFPIKTDFPYALERPDPSILHPAVPETPTNNNLEIIANKLPNEPTFISSNQWNSVEDPEARIVTNSKQNPQNNNQISVTLKTYTEKPIAVAYTPTESYKEYADKFSMPNYGSVVIPEIRPGSDVDSDSEFTVSAVMHTHPQLDLGSQNLDFINRNKQKVMEKEKVHDKIDANDESTNPPAQLDFQAPFQASANIDHSVSQGWAVVRDSAKDKKDEEVTTFPASATTSEFDIENFKPQLEGGFKPIYSYDDDEKKDKMQVSERQE